MIKQLRAALFYPLKYAALILLALIAVMYPPDQAPQDLDGEDVQR